MLDSKQAHQITSEGNTNGISRRTFFRDLSIFSFMAIAGAVLLNGCKPPVEQLTTTPALPPLTPDEPVSSASQITLMEAFKNRKSTNSMQTKPLPQSVLLELLWAAWGINRPDSGKRTAPSAMNAQEIDIYVLLEGGTYVYDAKENDLKLVVEQDLRPRTMGRAFMKDAPVHLIYVADYSKFKIASPAEQQLWSASHTGFIGQNVYLYCTTQGLGAHFYASVDRNAMKSSLHLRDEQAVIFGQAVGYSNE